MAPRPQAVIGAGPRQKIAGLVPLESWPVCCELSQPVWETQACPSHRRLGLRALDMEPGWSGEMHRAAHGDFGTATPDSCHHHTQRPVRCSWDAMKDTAVGHGKPAGKFRGCLAARSPARGREQVGLPGAGTIEGGTQQAHSRGTINAC